MIAPRRALLTILGCILPVVVSLALATGHSDAGPGLPDLVVNSTALNQQWVVDTENLAATDCAVVEGNVQPGIHKVLRFTVATANVGTANLVLGDPHTHMALGDGLYEYATCHSHFHFRHYTLYQLVDPRTGYVWRSAKRGFCMVDSAPAPSLLVSRVRNAQQFTTCGNLTLPGNQGLSIGWEDSYPYYINGQYILLDGGDGQRPVPPGRYFLRITVDPVYVPTPGETCRYVDPRQRGGCHELPESNYYNNVAQALVTIPAGPGPSGPLASVIGQISHSCSVCSPSTPILASQATHLPAEVHAPDARLSPR